MEPPPAPCTIASPTQTSARHSATPPSGVGDTPPPHCQHRAVEGGARTELGESRRMMARPNSIHLTRRDMLKLSAGGAGMFALTASGFAVPRGFGAGGGGGSLYLEAFPTSPLIVSPFTDELPIPQALRPADRSNPKDPKNLFDPRTNKQINPTDRTVQDCESNVADGDYFKRYGHVLGQHSVWCDDLKMTDPIVYKIDLEVAEHPFTTSKVRPINSF